MTREKIKGWQKLAVQDGKWVAQVTLLDYEWGDTTRIAQIVSLHEGNVERHEIESEKCEPHGETAVFGPYTIKTTLFVSENPFGVVIEDFDLLPSEASLDEVVGFEPARQLCNGEPKALPKMRTPSFFRGTKQWRWAKLVELAKLLNASPEDVFQRYFEFGNSQLSELRLFTLVAIDSPKGELVEVDDNLHLSLNPKYKHLGAGKLEPSRVWMPAGWIMHICLMHKFGVVPEICVKDHSWSDYDE